MPGAPDIKRLELCAPVAFYLSAITAEAPRSRRVTLSILTDHLVAHMRRVCKELGAVDLIDVANLPREKANSLVRTAVDACLGKR